MKLKKINILIGFILLLNFFNPLKAQIPSNVYHFKEKSASGDLEYELKIDKDYLVLTTYVPGPAKFIKTYGGYYSIADNNIIIQLEFNSDYVNDKITSLEIPFKINNGFLILDGPSKMTFTPTAHGPQNLDGKWLITGRIIDRGEERMDTSRPRKTMKFLLNGHFQWIAFNSQTFEFFGCGGGNYEAKDGKYVEKIIYFSRDNSRAGAELTFNFELNDNDWYHTGKSSKGNPLNEIWTRREHL